MTGTSDDEAPERAGYKRPPKSGQFRKGHSGNPLGRPRKDKAPVTLPGAWHPTREVLRREAARMIAVTDAQGRQEITAREAVMRALAVNAMRGGVLAQRTYVDLLMTEDERYHEERRASFEFWRAYKERETATLAAARLAGRPEPLQIPHPDDLRLEYETLNVQFLGPVDEETHAACCVVQELREVCWLMAMYHDNAFIAPSDPSDRGRMSIYMALCLGSAQLLPPRLQQILSMRDVDPAFILEQQASGGAELKRRCHAIGLPFWPRNRTVRLPMVPLKKLGLDWPKLPEARGVLRTSRRAV